MIPKRMESFLHERLYERTWKKRLVRRNGLCSLEFSSVDVDRLARLDIEVDQLGPRQVVCMWDEESALEVGGYLVVDNLAMGKPSVGGIRMLPDITPAAVFNLARGMTLKNSAADLPFGGGKAGIIAERSLTPDEHNEVVRRFAHLLYRYRDVFIPGPDVGTTDADMKTIAIESGLDNAISKPVEMGGSRVDQIGAAAGGLVIALQTLLKEMSRLKVLPQFNGLQIPEQKDITVLIQGFGAVGAHTARLLNEKLPGLAVVGISDALGYLYDRSGLPVDTLFKIWQERGQVTRTYFNEVLLSDRWGVSQTKYSSAANELLREPAFCLIPSSPVAYYLGVDASTQPSMTVDTMGNWAVIIEGANTYSPERSRKAARARMEREVYRNRGILIATDFLVNSGSVIFAVQERLIKTPPELRIPDEMLGNAPVIEKWLEENRKALQKIAEKRRHAAELKRDEVIHRNIKEMVDLLVANPEMLPYEAAEHISIRRVVKRESDRKVAEIMAPISTITEDKTVREAAALLLEANRQILAVVTGEGELAGVVTDWDITCSTAQGFSGDHPLNQIMSKKVVTVGPSTTILDVVRKLEHYEISAVPVVEGGIVLGMVSADLLARQTLLRLLQSKVA
jgi:glutamate dehydrogenase/leucine dehydrogenase/predicted transcriptional regulator